VGGTVLSDWNHKLTAPPRTLIGTLIGRNNYVERKLLKENV